MPTPDLFTLIFEQFLKISPTLINKYTTIQDQLLYLILIPHVVLLLFLWSFGEWISRGRPRFHILLSIVGYIFIIFGGWYGTFIVPIVVSWFIFLIAGAFVFFLLTYIIHPARGPAAYKLAGEVGKSIGKATIGKEKKRGELERQIDEIDAMIAAIKSTPASTAEAQNYRDMQIQQLEAKKASLQHQLDNL